MHVSDTTYEYKNMTLQFVQLLQNYFNGSLLLLAVYEGTFRGCSCNIHIYTN